MADPPRQVATRVATDIFNHLKLLRNTQTGNLPTCETCVVLTHRGNFRLAKNYSMYTDTHSRWIEQLYAGLTTSQV
jgi:hypothetical protein